MKTKSKNYTKSGNTLSRAVLREKLDGRTTANRAIRQVSLDHCTIKTTGGFRKDIGNDIEYLGIVFA
jgi:hypothetical protein